MKIYEVGFIRRIEFVLYDVEEDVKVDMINKYSEKLVFVFGLFVISNNMSIIIIKNFRICGDCYFVMKFVSLIEKRIIIVRDSKRFYYFVNGICFCRDYW